MSLNFLTLNTGYSVSVPRANVARDLVDRLLPVLDAGRGPLPGLPGFYLHGEFPSIGAGRVDGCAFVEISREPAKAAEPYVMALVAWRPQIVDVAWEQLIVSYRDLRAARWPLLPDPPVRPPPLPWMAIVLLPRIGGCDVATLLKFGPLAAAIAWALIEP